MSRSMLMLLSHSMLMLCHILCWCSCLKSRDMVCWCFCHILCWCYTPFYVDAHVLNPETWYVDALVIFYVDAILNSMLMLWHILCWCSCLKSRDIVCWCLCHILCYCSCLKSRNMVWWYTCHILYRIKIIDRWRIGDRWRMGIGDIGWMMEDRG